MSVDNLIIRNGAWQDFNAGWEERETGKNLSGEHESKRLLTGSTCTILRRISMEMTDF